MRRSIDDAARAGGWAEGGAACAARVSAPENVMVELTIKLSDDQAEAYAEFLKRVGFSDYRSLSVDHEEAYLMVSAGEAVREELRQVGFDPR